MGASAGTGVRSFAEGGSTSAPSGNSLNLATVNRNYARALADPSSVTLDTSRPGLGAGFGGINPEAIRADSRAFGIGPAAESLQRDLAREQAPQRQIYQAQYDDYGLGATPQARGFLGSILNPSKYGNLMPTFNRPQMGPQLSSANLPGASQPAYRIPYGPSVPQRGGMFGARSTVDPNLAAINQAFGPRQAQYDSDGNPYNAPVYMDQSQRDAILANPGKYLEYAQYVKGGGNPSQFAYSQRPVQYMTQRQRDALTKSQRSQLESILPPSAPVDSGGGG